MERVDTIAWDLDLAYSMVRQRDHALTDRQRALQDEESRLEDRLRPITERLAALGNSIGVVEKAGGDATNLRAQAEASRTEAAPIQARLEWLNQATNVIAANLRLVGSAHDSLHWLNFENAALRDLDTQPEPPKVQP